MSVEIIASSIEIRCYARFSDLPIDVSESFAYRSGVCFFSSIEWFICLQQFGFVDSPMLRLFTTANDSGAGRSVGLLCLTADERRRQLFNLTNYYTVEFAEFLTHAEPSRPFFQSIVREIREDPLNWSVIELRYLCANSPDTRQLLSAFAAAGYKIDLFHQYWNWYACVEGLTYSAFLAKRPARLRNTLRRKLRRVEAKFQFRVAIVKTIDALTTALPDYLEVYDRSWKQPEIPASFVPQLIRLCAELGILRLGILYLDDRPVAVQFWIADRNVAYIYKLAHDERYSDYSIGSILTAHMFEQAIDVDNVEEINFGVGDEAYKRDWMSARRQVIGLQALNSGLLRGRLLFARAIVRNSLRRLGLRAYTAVELAQDHDDSAAVKR